LSKVAVEEVVVVEVVVHPDAWDREEQDLDLLLDHAVDSVLQALVEPHQVTVVDPVELQVAVVPLHPVVDYVAILSLRSHPPEEDDALHVLHLVKAVVLGAGDAHLLDEVGSGLVSIPGSPTGILATPSYTPRR
jgi:hypothetical protein